MGESLMMSLSMLNHLIKSEAKDNQVVGVVVKQLPGANPLAEHIRKCQESEPESHQNIRPKSVGRQRPSRR